MLVTTSPISSSGWPHVAKWPPRKVVQDEHFNVCGKSGQTVLFQRIAENMSQKILNTGTNAVKHSLDSKSKPEPSAELDEAFLIPLS